MDERLASQSNQPAAPASLAQDVAKGAAWLFAVRIASRSLGLISTLVLARLLLPADFGLVAMATALSQSVNAFSEVGLREALVRHPTDARSLYDTAFTLQVARGLITGLVIALAAPFSGPLLGDPRLGSILLVLAALAVLSGFENIAVAEFRRDFRFDKEFLIQVLPRVLQVATAITAAILLRSYWALLIAIAVSAIVRLAATYAILPRRPRFTLRGWRELFSFSFWSWACSVASVAWLRSDAFIITSGLGAAAFGLYSVAWEVGWLPVSEIIAPAAAALFSGFAEAHRRGGEGGLAPIGVVAFLMLLTVPLAVAISAAAGPVVAVMLGPTWDAARPLVAIATLYCFVAPFGWVAAALLSASGRIARYFVVTLVSAVVRIAMLVYATRGGDLVVVSWWSFASLVFEVVVFALVLRRSGELRARDGAGSILRTLLAALSSAALLWLTGWGWQPAANHHTLRAFIDGAAIGIVVILAFAAVAGALWWLSGAPRGPETRLAEAARQMLRKLTSYRPRWLATGASP